MAVKKYAPKKITGSWSPPGTTIQPTGFMDGTFLEVEYAEDAVTIHVGADGTVSYVLNANRLAYVTLTLAQTSPDNARLSAQVPDPDANRLPSGPMSWKDLNGNTLVSGQDAAIVKTAKVEFGKSLTGRQWKFAVPNAVISVGQGGD